MHYSDLVSATALNVFLPSSAGLAAGDLGSALRVFFFPFFQNTFSVDNSRDITAPSLLFSPPFERMELPFSAKIFPRLPPFLIFPTSPVSFLGQVPFFFFPPFPGRSRVASKSRSTCPYLFFYGLRASCAPPFFSLCPRKTFQPFSTPSHLTIFSFMVSVSLFISFSINDLRFDKVTSAPPPHFLFDYARRSLLPFTTPFFSQPIRLVVHGRFTWESPHFLARRVYFFFLRVCATVTNSFRNPLLFLCIYAVSQRFEGKRTSQA